MSGVHHKQYKHDETAENQSLRDSHRRSTSYRSRATRLALYIRENILIQSHNTKYDKNLKKNWNTM